MIKKDVVILGGGASALMCAISIGNSRKVTILEKADRIGKKILATGNGRCNLTNNNMDHTKYNTISVKKYIDQFNNNKTIKLFKSLGLETYSDEEGRVYPISDSASSVLDVLRLKLDALHIETMCNIDVMSISKSKENFILKTNQGDIECKDLVLAVGGLNGAKYLDNLEVSYKPYVRSLGSIKSDKNIGLNGVKVDRVKVTLEIGDKKYSQNGEILFKDDALSGIVIFNLSSYIARENVDNAYVYIDFMKNMNIDDLKVWLTIRKMSIKDYKLRDYFTGVFHKALAINILSRIGIDIEKKVVNITDKEIDELANIIKSYRVKVYTVNNNNQVYSGGVSLDSLDDNLMVVKNPHLYCIGELVDVDAECGGYNLQWAWTSGYIVGKALSNK